MASTRSDPDVDDDFSDIYKEYTGPPVSTVNNAQDRVRPDKRSHAASDEEEGLRDPNAVPTDFTSREAKVWEAKSKATERNWKKRKEEEMICKLCGDSGHFTQGCPSTLGANRKSQDFFERIPARDKHVRALFTEKVTERIERDIGCKIKMDEKFIIVSGKDRLILKKGVDAVHKLKADSEHRGSSGPPRSRSRSPDQRSPVAPRSHNIESQRSHPGPRNASNFQQRFGRQDKVVEDRIREDQRKFSRGSPQAYANDRARSRSNHSKSPGHPHYPGNSYNPYARQNSGVSGYRTTGWDQEKPGSEIHLGHQYERPSFSQTLEELELEYKREALELERIRDKEEDEENKKHHETIREMRENYLKKMGVLRGMHAKQWEEFLQLDAQRRQQQAWQQKSASGIGGYRQLSYSDYDAFHGNPPYAAANAPMDSKGRYQNQMENYPSRPHDNYGGYQRQRREDFGKAYNRY